MKTRAPETDAYGLRAFGHLRPRARLTRWLSRVVERTVTNR